ncbi:TAP42-like family [Microdochium nivale]|nr:TAP42-like family [Microdochium nivale]
MEQQQPRTLKSVFATAESKRLSLENSYDTISAAYQDDLAEALGAYEDCVRIISDISLFSPNEALEDINTSDLPYLLVSYRLAELLQKVRTELPLDRKVALDVTREAYSRFLHLMDNYSLLSESDRKLFDRYTDDPEAFSTITSSDPTVRRNAKIANFKMEKEMKQKLEYMRRNPRYLDNGGGDEEAVRELYLADIAWNIHQAFQGLEGINRELEVIAQAPIAFIPQNSTIEDDERRRKASFDSEMFSTRLDGRLQSFHAATQGPMLSKEGKPLRPFTLTANRQEIQKGVFRSGHNLPTMSIDEYLDEERRRGNIIEGGGEASGRQPEPDEDNYEKADAETMKARDWDEFVENNPKGSGNTLNRG